MNDGEIIGLYWQRDETAIAETDKKYGSYCRSIAWNILRSREDTEECVSDTWLRAWNTMPPQKPTILASFLGTITRNLSLDRHRAGRTKRRGGELERVWKELEQCADPACDLESRITVQDLSRLLDQFLRSLPVRERDVFLRRYWYTDTIAEVAQRCRMSEGAVKVSLHRTRKKLRRALEKEGFTP